jgi:hypothetical protein
MRETGPIRNRFKFCKRATDDRDFAKFFLGWLFILFRRGMQGEGKPNGA